VDAEGKEKGKEKEKSEESIRRETERLQALLPSPSEGILEPASNLGPSPAPRSGR
jgi:hypothetical protein